ncbi:MAG: sensor histidine kinase [Methylococcus sp.]|nr:sensor histidine kinase [Methylococcus sp.]
MTISRLLLIAFLSLTFLASALLASLSFFVSREALAAEIGRNLGKDATLLMKQVDMQLFERLQNIHSWSELDVMQDARVGDVDKRLARFLTDIRHGYGEVYSELFFADKSGRVVASSTAAAIGRIHEPHAPWAGAKLPNGEVFLQPLDLQAPYSQASLLIHTPVYSRYDEREIGGLYGAFDLWQVFRLFDQAEHSVSGNRYVALVDQEGRLIAGSASLRNRGLLLAKALADWRPEGIATFTRDGMPVLEGEVLVGHAASRGYQGYPGLGWSLMVFQPTDQAFRSVRALLWLFSLVFLVTGLLAGVAALAVAGRIARPLVRLTAWTQDFVRHENPIGPHISGTREVKELGTAFGQMIENLQQSRQQVIHAAKLAMVGEMAAIMAHEVRTPLGILHTSAQMLQREPDLSAEGHELTRFMLDESARLERLISTLLECARPRPPRMRRSDVHTILHRVADLLAAQARKKNIRLGCTLEAENSVTACDEELLMQVFLNLVLNAIQITSPGGLVEIRSCSDREALSIEVNDDGPGIPAENRPKVFDPFFTTRDGGIGLGLTVTRQIVAAHGGSIVAEASEWGGARFRVTLPLKEEAAV